MSTLRISILVLGFFAMVHWSASALAPRAKPATPDAKSGVKSALAKGGDPKGDNPKKKRKAHFTVGKKTTYVTGPLDKDGYIDYAAALNKRLRQGVTPANNANVLLWKAFGPRPQEGRLMPPEFFRWLGIQAPPEKSQYFIDLYRYRQDHLKIDLRRVGDDIENQWNRVLQCPWTPKDHPDIASWLKANEKPLALVVKATKRPHYFSPLVPRGSSGLMGTLFPGVSTCSRLASALVIRAMLRAGQGAYDDAWQDLLASHRLGRLVARGGTQLDALVSIAIDWTAARADLAFFDRAKLNAKRIENCLRDLHKLPPLPVVPDQVILCERFMFLESVMMVDRYGIKHIKYVEDLFGGNLPKTPNPLPERILEGVDWDPALRNANRWYDRLAAAMRGKDRGVRENKWGQIERELKALKQKVVASGGLAQLSFSGQKGKGKVIGDILVSLMIPGVRKVQSAADRARQVQDNLCLAFALAWYQRNHGHYPKELDALAPKYLMQIPQDMFSGKALIYRPSKKGYLLYSVGLNGKDEEGRWYDDNPPGDDLSVRMPLPKRKQQ